MAGLSARFRLRKWYLDCVSDEGTAFVGYAGRVRLGPLPLSYQGSLVSMPDEPATGRFTMLPARMPDLTEGEVTWRNRRLAVRGSWRRLSAATERVLSDDGEVRVVWRCFAPACHARVTIRGASIEGPGYAEVLEVSGPPARLPIDELRWGRFVSGAAHLVWIDWRGEKALRLVLADGAFVRASRVDREVVESDAGTLAMTEHRALRTGTVEGAVFGRSSPLARLLPAGVGGWIEEKWVSRAFLARAGAAPLEGWAIHERVRLR